MIRGSGRRAIYRDREPPKRYAIIDVQGCSRELSGFADLRHFEAWRQEGSYAFDVDDTLEVSGGPVSVQSIADLKRAGDVVGLNGNWGVMVQKRAAMASHFQLYWVKRGQSRVTRLDDYILDTSLPFSV